MNSSPLSKQVENKLDGAARSISQAGENVSERFEKFTHDAGKKIGSLTSKVSGGAAEYVETSRDYIKENPLQAAAIAAAAGAAVGCLLTLVARRK